MTPCPAGPCRASATARSQRQLASGSGRQHCVRPHPQKRLFFCWPMAAPRTPTRFQSSSATSPAAVRSRRKSSKKSVTAIR